MRRVLAGLAVATAAALLCWAAFVHRDSLVSTPVIPPPVVAVPVVATPAEPAAPMVAPERTPEADPVEVTLSSPPEMAWGSIIVEGTWENNSPTTARIVMQWDDPFLLNPDGSQSSAVLSMSVECEAEPNVFFMTAFSGLDAPAGMAEATYVFDWPSGERSSYVGLVASPGGAGPLIVRYSGVDAARIVGRLMEERGHLRVSEDLQSWIRWPLDGALAAVRGLPCTRYVP